MNYKGDETHDGELDMSAGPSNADDAAEQLPQGRISFPLFCFCVILLNSQESQKSMSRFYSFELIPNHAVISVRFIYFMCQCRL